MNTMKLTLQNLIVILNLITTLLLKGVLCNLPQQTNLRIELDKAGMHRKLKYTIQFDQKLLDMNCKYMLSQPLPSAVYISTDELDDLRRMKMLSAVYPKFVDIEIITQKAKPLSILLRGVSPTITIPETLTLPIHFRYHAASNKRTKATVEISKPKLYLNCPIGDEVLNHTESLDGMYKFYCLNKHKCHFEEPLKPIELEDCTWQQLVFNYQTQEPLRAEIPVGDANGYTPILYVTIALIWVASIWTVLRTQPVSHQITKVLNEQRLLNQQKAKDKYYKRIAPEKKNLK